MADKMICPACDSYASDILRAFNEGEPCPVCNLSASVTAEILRARERGANTELTEKYTEAMIRMGEAEAEAAKLRSQLSRIRSILAEGTAQ